MHPTKHLFEGMRSGDLADLVLPLISIDEFESKIDKDAIVIGFYVTDTDAADDLNRFIQRSPVEILDSDVSPAPDQNGHFMVFVELLNNKTAVDNILSIVMEVSPLCNIDGWDAQIRGHDDIEELEKDTLTKALADNKAYDREQKQQDKANDVREGVIKALSESDLEDVTVLDRNGRSMICLRTLVERVEFDVLACGDPTTILETHCAGVAIDLCLTGVTATNRVQRLLGPNWDVHALGDVQMWRRLDDLCLLVRPA